MCMVACCVESSINGCSTCCCNNWLVYDQLQTCNMTHLSNQFVLKWYVLSPIMYELILRSNAWIAKSNQVSINVLNLMRCLRCMLYNSNPIDTDLLGLRIIRAWLLAVLLMQSKNNGQKKNKLILWTQHIDCRNNSVAFGGCCWKYGVYCGETKKSDKFEGLIFSSYNLSKCTTNVPEDPSFWDPLLTKLRGTAVDLNNSSQHSNAHPATWLILFELGIVGCRLCPNIDIGLKPWVIAKNIHCITSDICKFHHFMCMYEWLCVCVRERERERGRTSVPINS